jgi:hypothetical protein
VVDRRVTGGRRSTGQQLSAATDAPYLSIERDLVVMASDATRIGHFLRGQRLFPWHGPFLAGDRADEYAGLHATGAGRSALLNYIFFVRTFDLALGNRLCARPGTGRRIAIKSAEALEHMEKVDTLVVDKTGTLTEGKPKVTAIVPIAGLSESEILPLAASLERSSEHPLAAAIVTAARDRNASIQEPTDFASVRVAWWPRVRWGPRCRK